jgi:DMSO/TMAO reductase YedYZ molybdopterin-dependent catalytic subunit
MFMRKLIILFLATLILGCVSRNVIKLDSVEVRDYNGTRLDSINDFVENSIKGPQYVNVSTYVLEITGLVANPKNYSYNEVLSHQAYSKVVTVNCVEGWSVTIDWEGVLLKDLFNDVSVFPNATTVIFYAVDGYSTAEPLDYLLNNNIMIAYKMNNVTLPAERGYPFQLVAQDKWGYKWIKWINRIELSNDSNYKGFWESRGYNNKGLLNESRFS